MNRSERVGLRKTLRFFPIELRGPLRCPLYPRKRTCAMQLAMSALGRKRTSIGLRWLPRRSQRLTFVHHIHR
jgi:hypothetical protein